MEYALLSTTRKGKATSEAREAGIDIRTGSGGLPGPRHLSRSCKYLRSFLTWVMKEWWERMEAAEMKKAFNGRRGREG